MITKILDADGNVAIEYDNSNVIIHTGTAPHPIRIQHLNDLAREHSLDHQLFVSDIGQLMIDIDGVIIEYMDDAPGLHQFTYQRRC